jgi:ankyrin repeat protein
MKPHGTASPAPNPALFLEELNDQLLKAASEGDTEKVANLLDQGADIHTHDDYALGLAARAGHIKTVRLLLERGADVHGDEGYALRWAAEKVHPDVVALLLTHYNYKELKALEKDSRMEKALGEIRIALAERKGVMREKLRLERAGQSMEI